MKADIPHGRAVQARSKECGQKSRNDLDASLIGQQTAASKFTKGVDKARNLGRLVISVYLDSNDSSMIGDRRKNNGLHVKTAFEQ